jgi:rod shape-determining protein MreD
MRVGSWLLALAVVALLACGPLPCHVASAWRPDLFVILVVYAALRTPPGLPAGRVAGADADTLAMCWMTGLAKDLLSSGPLGQYALLYLAAGAVIARMRPAVDARSAVSGAALAWAAAFATECVAAWAVGRDGGRLWPMPGAFRGVLSASLVTACVAWLSFRVLDRLLRRKRKASRLRASFDELGGAV